MGHLAAFFTFISGPCSIILIILLSHFLYSIQDHVQKRREHVPVNPITKICGTTALAGYTSYVIAVFLLDLYSSACHFPSLGIPYSKVICQMHAFSIVLFMMGKFGMWFFFMALVYTSFKGSFLEYSPRVLGTIAVIFSVIMCTIGGLYIFLLYRDFGAVESIETPIDCLCFKVSTATRWVIRSGYTFDAIWNFTCLYLFYRRLRTLQDMMNGLRRGSDVKEEKTKETQNQKHAVNPNGAANVKCSSTSPTSVISPNTMIPQHLKPRNSRESNEVHPSQESAGHTEESNVSDHEPSVVIIYDDHDDHPNELSPPMPPTTMQYAHSHSSNTATNSTDRDAFGMPPLRNSVDSIGRPELRPRNRSLSVPDPEPESMPRKVSISELRKRVHAKREQKKKEQGMVDQFLPVMLKMTILSMWCALSTVVIFGVLGGKYPTLAGVLDSLINGICVYLSFAFTRRIYEILCSPILACKNCTEYMDVVHEMDEIRRDSNCD